jgi:hypothetical protein
MEISLLCGAQVLLCVVDKKDKSILYMSDNSKPEDFIEKYVESNIRNKTYLANDDVRINFYIV